MATKRKPDAPFDRVPPYNEDAERAVLGAMLLNPDTVGTAIEVLHGAASELFYFPQHQYIYDAILKMYRNSRPIDAVTLKEQLVADGRLEDAGGLPYIAQLSGLVPTSANIEHYANIVLDKSLLRRLISSCTRVIGEAYEAPEDVSTLLDRAEGDLFQIAERRQVNPVECIENLISASVEQIERQIKQGEAVTGVPTGFDRLDELTAGFQPSDMVVLAARPSVGKTAMGLNIARYAAIEHNRNVLIFSLEMSKAQLVQRLLCMQGRVNSHKLRAGFLANQEFQKVQKAAGDLHNSQIYIDDTPSISVMELRAKARRHAAKNGCDLIIVDYIQLMRATGRFESRQVEISEVSRSVKSIARELNVPVLALSQLNREAEKDDEGRPKIGHIRDSGAIEQDADVIMMLYRAKDQPEESNRIVRVNLDLGKQRNGPTGEIKMVFEKDYQRFGQLARDGEMPATPPPPSEPGGYEPDYEEESPF